MIVVTLYENYSLSIGKYWENDVDNPKYVLEMVSNNSKVYMHFKNLNELKRFTMTLYGMVAYMTEDESLPDCSYNMEVNRNDKTL